MAVGRHRGVEPGVQVGARPLVRVEEERDPGRGRVGELAQEDRGEHLLRGEDQLEVLVVAEAGDEARAQPARALGDLVRVQQSRQRADDRHHPGGHHPRPGHQPPARRRPAGLLRLRVQGREGRQLRLVPALAVGGEPAVQVLQAAALGGELAADLRHHLRHAAGAVVDVRGQRAPFAGDLLQLPEEEGLSDAGVAVHVEAEAVAFVVRRGVEVGAEGGPFGGPADESGPAPPAYQLLHRRSRLRHPFRPPRLAGRPASSFSLSGWGDNRGRAREE